MVTESAFIRVLCTCVQGMYWCMVRIFLGLQPWEIPLIHPHKCGLFVNGSRCHGNMRLNDDSKSQRSISIALRVIISPVDVCGGQSAREVYNDIITAILYLL